MPAGAESNKSSFVRTYRQDSKESSSRRFGFIIRSSSERVSMQMHRF
jgi:hypothetical protein